jgi:ABC-type proline/glycine betaine transport system permease subunit
MGNSRNINVFDAHYSSAAKYYNALFIFLVAIPLGIGCFVSLNGPIVFTIIMFSCTIPCIALIVYLAISSGRSRYELSCKELGIKILFYNKKISYTQIVNAEKVELSLLVKLFGAGMPGLYCGRFSTSIGNVQAYATKLKGEYIALTLKDGKK